MAFVAGILQPGPHRSRQQKWPHPVRDGAIVVWTILLVLVVPRVRRVPIHGLEALLALGTFRMMPRVGCLP